MGFSLHELVLAMTEVGGPTCRSDMYAMICHRNAETRKSKEANIMKKSRNPDMRYTELCE